MSDNIIEYIKRREEERSKLLKEEQQPVEEEVIELTPEQKWVEVIKENKKEVVIQKAKSIDSSIVAKEKQKDQHKDVTFDDLVDTTEVVKKPTQPIVIEKKKKTIHEVLEETFANTIKERKQEQLIQQSNININFKQPFELEKLQEIALIEKINDIIKFRDPVLEKMEYREWVKILQNKMVDELDPGYAKKLYEQDMSRVEKYDALSKKSGGGRNRVAVTVEEDPSFDPTTIASLVGWYDAADASTITLNGDLVSQWDDKSGNGYHVYQASAASQPKYQATSTIFNIPTIRWGYDSTRHFLQIASSQVWATFSGVRRNASMFIVFHWPGVGQQAWSDFIRLGNSYTVSIYHHPVYQLGTSFYYANGWQCTGGTPATSLPNRVLGGWLFTDDGSTTRVNGAVDATDSTKAFDTSATNKSNQWLFGGNYNAWTNLEIGEILMFHTELTGDDLANVESYLNDKWSIY